ncbi:Laccase-2 [Cytospora mali]|uniref:Laccase-2 n=1 Tax=Cytospora mali TaxID=578113 RepID=A0A194V4P6_CYTMA|nr:Laccase-2 [Valsa mali var. pyri (nom. inval.)]
MGFFKSCLEQLIRLVALTPFNPLEDFFQQPLLGSGDIGQVPLVIPGEPADTIIHPEHASPGFQCVYPKRWKSCNTPTSRDCWLQDTQGGEFASYSQIDINTDYENPDAIPRGTTRESQLYADGFKKTSGKAFNKQYPGPLIEACWGDELVIHVKNNYDKNGTTIHWHGIRQLNTNHMDGVNGVTQCPIAKGDEFTYRFRALQYGHTWYHSHYSLQYPDGLVGPLVIHGPSSSNWDVDLGPVLIQDYVHDSSFVRYSEETSSVPGSFARADSIVVNGAGHDPLTGNGTYFETTFAPKKKHVLRLINGSAGTHYVVSIDNHTMTVIENDLVPIEPYNTTALSIGIGQRYMVIVDADQEPGDYWIRTHPATGCNGFNATLPCNGIFSATCSPFNVTTGIIRYNTTSPPDNKLPTSKPWNYNHACADEPYKNLKPIVPWTIDHHPQNEITKGRFAAAHQNIKSSQATGGYAHWMLTPDFLWLDFESPTILNVENENYEKNSNYHIVEDNFESGFIFMIIEASNNTNIPLPGKPGDVSVLNISHPLHWHGMDVVLLAQSNTTFDPVNSYKSFNFVNPPRRDVILLPAGGYIAIAFKPDNPGAWLVHCHIAWHASAGLGLQILERQAEIVSSLGGPSALDDTKRVCRNWKQFDKKHPVEQDDSGI